MQFLVLGFGALAILLLIARWFVRAPAHQVARQLRIIGGILALVVAGALALVGRFALSAPLAGFAFMLLTGTGPFAKAKPSSGQTSSVRTDWLEMILDHDTGAMHGTVLRGRFSGRPLADLGQEDLITLATEIEHADPRSGQLLAAYLERTFPDWRSFAGGAHGEAGSSAGAGSMSREEALAILGLEEGASEADIHKAHRSLMKKLHPDQGGSTYLATKLNEAKERLLGE